MRKLRTIKQKIAEIGLEARLKGVEIGILGNGNKIEYLTSLLEKEGGVDDYFALIANKRKSKEVNEMWWRSVGGSAEPNTLIDAVKIKATEIGLRGYLACTKEKGVEYLKDLLLGHKNRFKKNNFVKAAYSVLGRFYEKNGARISREAFSRYQLKNIMSVYDHIFLKPRNDKVLSELRRGDMAFDNYMSAKYSIVYDYHKYVACNLYHDSMLMRGPIIDESTRTLTAKGIVAYEDSRNLLDNAQHYYKMGGRIKERNRVYRFENDFVLENLYMLRNLLPYLNQRLGGEICLDKIKDEVMRELKIKH